MNRFFNLPTCAMLAFIAIAMLSAVLSPAINWIALIWMVISAIWVVIARLNQLTSEGWKRLYNISVDDLAALRGHYQALDNEYTKLVKRNEVTAKENAKHRARVEDLSKQYNEVVAKYEAAAQQLNDLTKVPSSRTKKRRPVKTEGQ